MIRFMVVMVPLVFLINGFTKHDWKEAFLFALAVAVGLTPEMLPMIVSVGLSKGALAMSRKKVIVKRLNAIQNFGAMDVLCTDKTGTLTLDHVVLEKYCDVVREENEDVLLDAYLISHFQTGLKNILDRAILDHKEVHGQVSLDRYAKVDEIPFDFVRRMMSVVVRDARGRAPPAGQGRAGRDLPPLHALRAGRRSLADGADRHRRPAARVRAAQRRRLPRAGRRLPRRPGAAGLFQGRRVRPGAQGLRRLPRPAQGDRLAGHQGPAQRTAWR